MRLSVKEAPALSDANDENEYDNGFANFCSRENENTSNENGDFRRRTKSLPQMDLLTIESAKSNNGSRRRLER